MLVKQIKRSANGTTVTGNLLHVLVGSYRS